MRAQDIERVGFLCMSDFSTSASPLCIKTQRWLRVPDDEGGNGAYGTPLIFWEEQKVWRYPILLGKYEVGNYDYWTNMVFVCPSVFTYQREHLFFYFMGHPKAHLSLYVTQLTTFSIQPTDPFLWCVFYMMVGAKMQKWRAPRFSCLFQIHHAITQCFSNRFLLKEDMFSFLLRIKSR